IREAGVIIPAGYPIDSVSIIPFIEEYRKNRGRQFEKKVTGISAFYGGSFDPVTNGHLDVIKRAAAIFDTVYVGIGVNPAKEGKYWFTKHERKKMIEDAVKAWGLTNVKVVWYEGYTTDCARKLGARILLRGARDFKDLGEELPLAWGNSLLAPQIQTVFILPYKYLNVSSSFVKKLLENNAPFEEVRASVSSTTLNSLLQRYSERGGVYEGSGKNYDGGNINSLYYPAARFDMISIEEVLSVFPGITRVFMVDPIYESYMTEETSKLLPNFLRHISRVPDAQGNTVPWLFEKPLVEAAGVSVRLPVWTSQHTKLDLVLAARKEEEIEWKKYPAPGRYSVSSEAPALVVVNNPGFGSDLASDSAFWMRLITSLCLGGYLFVEPFCLEGRVPIPLPFNELGLRLEVKNPIRILSGHAWWIYHKIEKISSRDIFEAFESRKPAELQLKNRYLKYEFDGGQIIFSETFSRQDIELMVKSGVTVQIAGINARGEAVIKQPDWFIFNTPLNEVSSVLSIPLHESLSSYIIRKANDKFPGTLNIIDWGAGNLRAAKELAEYLTSHNVNNVKIIAFGNTFDRSWLGSLPKNIICIVDIERNLLSHVARILPAGEKIDIVYSHRGLEFLLSGRKKDKFLRHIEELSGFLSENGTIVSTIQLEETTGYEGFLDEIMRRTHKNARIIPLNEFDGVLAVGGDKKRISRSAGNNDGGNRREKNNFTRKRVYPLWQKAIAAGIVKYDPGVNAEVMNIGVHNIWYIPERAGRPGAALRQDEKNPLVLKDHTGDDDFCLREKAGTLNDIANFAQLDLKNSRWLARFNEYPIFPAHFLLLPVEEDGMTLIKQPQVITKDNLEDITGWIQSHPQVRAFYNSLSAGASQNHFHYQVIFNRLPVEYLRSSPWFDLDFANIGRIPEYPAGVITVDGEQEERIKAAWNMIEMFHKRTVPFNMLINDTTIYLFPRNALAPSQFPEVRFASLEMCGEIILVNWIDYLSLNEEIREKSKEIREALIQQRKQGQSAGLKEISALTSALTDAGMRGSVDSVYRAVIDNGLSDIIRPESLEPVYDLVDTNDLLSRVRAAYNEVSLSQEAVTGLLSESYDGGDCVREYGSLAKAEDKNTVVVLNAFLLHYGLVEQIEEDYVVVRISPEEFGELRERYRAGKNFFSRPMAEALGFRSTSPVIRFEYMMRSSLPEGYKRILKGLYLLSEVDLDIQFLKLSDLVMDSGEKDYAKTSGLTHGILQALGLIDTEKVFVSSRKLSAVKRGSIRGDALETLWPDIRFWHPAVIPLSRSNEIFVPAKVDAKRYHGRGLGIRPDDFKTRKAQQETAGNDGGQRTGDTAAARSFYEKEVVTAEVVRDIFLSVGNGKEKNAAFDRLRNIYKEYPGVFFDGLELADMYLSNIPENEIMTTDIIDIVKSVVSLISCDHEDGSSRA
ncbi:MAG: pantetheine-phosphate adenylyltransferase, partial [Candidatus Omnitrophica bacterium]|nr:pantetheine-phosphate adenylyltransferase [Candidatus Omnitrophota bacterium]